MEKYVLLYNPNKYAFFSQMLFAEMGRELPEWFQQGRTQAHTQVRIHFPSLNLKLIQFCLLLHELYINKILNLLHGAHVFVGEHRLGGCCYG
jgi:hypothetical protein